MKKTRQQDIPKMRLDSKILDWSNVNNHIKKIIKRMKEQ